MLSPSEMQAAPRSAADVAALQLNRAAANLRLAAKSVGGTTRLADLVEGGGYRIKFPDPERGLEAVIVNTGGGLLGGDRLALDIAVGEQADLMVTTQSAEKIYRAVAAPSEINTRLTVANEASLQWLPQEAILFSGACLTRTISADMAENSALMIAEAAVFGRLAMGEVLGQGLLADRWRIRRGGALAFAEDVRLEGPLAAMLDRPALGGGARAMATLVVLAPDAEGRLDRARDLMRHDGLDAGASAWDGKLVVRLLASDPAPLRQAMAVLVGGLSGRPTPRFW